MCIAKCVAAPSEQRPMQGGEGKAGEGKGIDNRGVVDSVKKNVKKLKKGKKLLDMMGDRR